jgi:hypothetical protein
MPATMQLPLHTGTDPALGVGTFKHGCEFASSLDVSVPVPFCPRASGFGRWVSPQGTRRLPLAVELRANETHGANHDLGSIHRYRWHPWLDCQQDNADRCSTGCLPEYRGRHHRRSARGIYTFHLFVGRRHPSGHRQSLPPWSCTLIADVACKVGVTSCEATASAAGERTVIDRPKCKPRNIGAAVRGVPGNPEGIE